MGTELEYVRNIGIAAHIDAGKTTTTERILYYTGRTHKMGEVHLGTTTTDFDEEEQKRGITIYSAAVSCPWKDHTINLIDTPGHVDFTAEVERSLRVLDGMVAVFDAREGVEPQSETVWKQAAKYHVPRLCFINKMDRLGADFERSIASIQDRLQIIPLVLQYPIGEGDQFAGLIDLLEMQAVYYKTEKLGSTFEFHPIPEGLWDKAHVYRHQLMEVLADTSERLMEKYVSEEPISADEIHSAIRSATLSQEYVPVLCGSALKYIGVQRLLDAVCRYLPSPLDVPSVQAGDARHPEKKIELTCDRNASLVGLVFKIVAEKPLDLYYLRIYSGTLKPNMRLLNTTSGEKENISRIHRMFAKRRETLNQAIAGDIVAVVGPKAALTGHTLCDQRRPVILESIEFPETVISVSVEPTSSKDRDKLTEALSALGRQDPTIRVSSNSETGQTLISGMGELHLEIVVQRLRNDMNVDVQVGKPRVTYRETVGATGVGSAEFDRQIGGRRHFAGVQLRLEPRAQVKSGANFEVAMGSVDEATLEAIPTEMVQAAERGIQDAAQSGVLGGYPVINWKATILGLTWDESDSSEVAFESAARAAYDQAMHAAVPILLQPIMDVEVVTPDDYFGAITSDLNARQAVVKDTVLRGQDRIIKAEAPLAQMFGYVTRLRSVSQGRATSSMTPSHYAPMPKAEMELLVG